MAGIPIKQRYPCINCKSDIPSRHYYLQCQQLCMFGKSPHWANTCPQIAQHLSAKKALAAHRRVKKEDRDMASAQLDGSRDPNNVQPSSSPLNNA